MNLPAHYNPNARLMDAPSGAPSIPQAQVRGAEAIAGASARLSEAEAGEIAYTAKQLRDMMTTADTQEQAADNLLDTYAAGILNKLGNTLVPNGDMANYARRGGTPEQLQQAVMGV